MRVQNEMHPIASVLEYNEHMQSAAELMPNVSDFPRNIFRKRPTSYTFFEFDLIFCEEFYRALCKVGSQNGESSIIVAATKPDPIGYFLKHFGYLPAIKVPLGDEYQKFSEFISRDPGESLAVAIDVRADQVTMVGEEKSVAVFGDREFEIGVIANFNSATLFDTNPPFMDAESAYGLMTRFCNYRIMKESFMRWWRD